MTLTSYVQKIQAEEAQKMAIELREQAKIQRENAETAKQVAEQQTANAHMLMEEAIIRSEKLKELANEE